MDQVFGFVDLKAGQRVKAKGKPGENGSFMALEIKVKTPDDQVAVEGLLQSIDQQNNTLCLLYRDFVLPDGIAVKHLQHNLIGLCGLKVGDMVKLKGRYTAVNGFVLEQIKMQETMGFNIEELQGNLNSIDLEKQTLDVLGFTVMVNKRTMIRGF